MATSVRPIPIPGPLGAERRVEQHRKRHRPERARPSRSHSFPTIEARPTRVSVCRRRGLPRRLPGVAPRTPGSSVDGGRSPVCMVGRVRHPSHRLWLVSSARPSRTPEPCSTSPLRGSHLARAWSGRNAAGSRPGYGLGHEAHDRSRSVGLVDLPPTGRGYDARASRTRACPKHGRRSVLYRDSSAVRCHRGEPLPPAPPCLPRHPSRYPLPTAMGRTWGTRPAHGGCPAYRLKDGTGRVDLHLLAESPSLAFRTMVAEATKTTREELCRSPLLPFRSGPSVVHRLRGGRRLSLRPSSEGPFRWSVSHAPSGGATISEPVLGPSVAQVGQPFFDLLPSGVVGHDHVLEARRLLLRIRAKVNGRMRSVQGESDVHGCHLPLRTHQAPDVMFQGIEGIGPDLPGTSAPIRST